MDAYNADKIINTIQLCLMVIGPLMAIFIGKRKYKKIKKGLR